MLNVGFVGTGGVAERHAEALKEIDGVRLASAWSRTPAKTEDFVRRHGGASKHSYESLLEDPQIDAVFILTTAETHVDYGIRALAAGKHVLLEKPVGESVEEIGRLQAAAAGSDRICMPSHNYIYSPSVRRLRHHLKQGRLGRPQSFWMLCNQKQTQDIGRPGMVMNDMMVHLAYSSIFFCGEPRSLVSIASNVYFDNGADDQVGITLRYADGTIANLWASWATRDVCREPWMCTMKVFGAEGTGVASWDNVKNHDLSQPGWDDSVYWDSFYFVQRYFLEECVVRGAAPLSSLEDALLARKILDAALLSLKTKAFVDVGA